MSLSFTAPLLFYLACGLYALSCILYLLSHPRTSISFLAGGGLLHLASIVIICSQYGIFALGRTLGQSVFLPCCLAMVAVILLRRNSSNSVAHLTPLAVVFAIIALVQPFFAKPPCPMMITPIIGLCLFFQTLAVACFFSSGLYALYFLRRNDHEQLFNQLAIWGFVFYSLAQLFGAIWSYLGWSSPFSWSRNHLETAAIWLLYCGYIHLHFHASFTPRSRAIWTTSAAVVVFILTVLIPLPNTVLQKFAPSAGPAFSASYHATAPTAQLLVKTLPDSTKTRQS